MSKIKEFDLFMRNMFTNEEKDQQNKIWQWIEQREERIIKIANNIHKALMDSAIKQARVDELERLQKGAEQLNTGGITFLAIANRIKQIKELNET